MVGIHNWVQAHTCLFVHLYFLLNVSSDLRVSGTSASESDESEADELARSVFFFKIFHLAIFWYTYSYTTITWRIYKLINL